MLPIEEIKKLSSSSFIHVLEMAQLTEDKLFWTMKEKCINTKDGIRK
jgi:hypothetical protein